MAVTIFGVVAVSFMMTMYALESRGRRFILAFAFGCLLSSAYGFLSGAWPFGVVEGIWSLVAGFLARIHPALADPQGTRANWVARTIHRVGETIRLRLHSGVVEGRFVGFGQDGELELEVGGKRGRFSTGELLVDKEPGG